MKAELLALADRCEREEASRELDLAIRVALYPTGDVATLTGKHRRGLDKKPGTAWDFWHNGALVFEVWSGDGQCTCNGSHVLPSYTTSLDAALTLVPENMLVENLGEMRDAGPLTGMWLAQLCPRGPRRRIAEISAAALRAACDADPCVHAKTAALALCAAALRARAALEQARADHPQEET